MVILISNSTRFFLCMLNFTQFSNVLGEPSNSLSIWGIGCPYPSTLHWILTTTMSQINVCCQVFRVPVRVRLTCRLMFAISLETGMQLDYQNIKNTFSQLVYGRGSFTSRNICWHIAPPLPLMSVNNSLFCFTHSNGFPLTCLFFWDWSKKNYLSDSKIRKVLQASPAPALRSKP